MTDPLSVDLPGTLVATALALHGQRGQEWLARIPEIVALCEVRWAIRVQPPFEGLSYNYLAPAQTGDGTPVVLKLGLPSVRLNPEFGSETEATRVFGGRGCVRLLELDPGLGALLLERALPGDTLATVADDEAATRIASRVMKRLWRPVPTAHDFPTTERWGQGFSRLRERFEGDTGPLPGPVVAKAESLFADLLSSSGPDVVLHGDLHHWNILRATREPWLAIDPKGVVGEPAYEVGALLRNFPDHLAGRNDMDQVTGRRLDVMAEELHIDRERLAGWGYAQSVLSAWWDLEDGTGDGSWAVHTARLIDQASRS